MLCIPIYLGFVDEIGSGFSLIGVLLDLAVVAGLWVLLDCLLTATYQVIPNTGAGGYIVEPRKQMAKVTESSGVAFTVHDLRRTFITIAESLDIPAYVLKRLLKHKNAGDVTTGYIVPDIERLREPMQKITGHILGLSRIRQTADTH